MKVKISDETDGTLTLKVEGFRSQPELVKFLEKLNNIVYSSPFGFKLARADKMDETEKQIIEFLKLING